MRTATPVQKIAFIISRFNNFILKYHPPFIERALQRLSKIIFNVERTNNPEREHKSNEYNNTHTSRKEILYI